MGTVKLCLDVPGTAPGTSPEVFELTLRARGVDDQHRRGEWLKKQLSCIGQACASLSQRDLVTVFVNYLMTADNLGPALVAVVIGQNGKNHTIVRPNSWTGAIVRETTEFGTVDSVFVNRDCGVYRLRIHGGKSIPTHYHARTEETEMVLTTGLLLQGKAAAPGVVRRWPAQFPHRYDNPTSVEQVILCIDCPAFDPADEVSAPDANLVDLDLSSSVKSWSPR